MTEGGSYISFGVEGVPYSQVRIDMEPREGFSTPDAIMVAVEWARLLADEYAKTFYPARADFPEDDLKPATGATPPVLWQGNAPPPDEEYAPSEPVRVAIDDGGNAVVVSTGVRVTGEVFACPNCKQKALPSIDQYQEWQVGTDGREYAQKWRCPNNNCSTKSLWRSKLVPLAPAGAR